MRWGKNAQKGKGECYLLVQHMNKIIELLGLASLLSFTFSDVILAILAGGAYISFFETNKAILIFEIFAGSFGITVALFRMKERLREDEKKKTFTKID
jgi:hypothetical protein